jgi:DNA-binding transcriptional LysR family regulator
LSVSYDYYKVFYCVAERGNISMAARELFLAQSTVSRTVQNLEQELGCKLLVRSTQGVRLTEDGKILHQHLKAAFAHIRMAEERLDNIQRLNEGMLRIGASELTLEFYLLPYLEKLKREHPKISVRLSYSNPERAVTEPHPATARISILPSMRSAPQAWQVRRLPISATPFSPPSSTVPSPTCLTRIRLMNGFTAPSGKRIRRPA